MEEKELEPELIGLGEEFRKEAPPSLIPSTLRILKGRGRRTPFLLRVGPAFLTLLLFLVLFSFTPFRNSFLRGFTMEPLLNLTKMISLVFSLSIGALFILNPEVMSRIDRRLIGSLSHKGTLATPLQERILFRVQGLYFFLIAFFICKL